MNEERLGRDPLLPDLERSRGVLVGNGTCPSPDYSGPSPATAARALARGLSARLFHEQQAQVPVFLAEHLTVLAEEEDAAHVVAALRRAADAASDVLLFSYAGHAELDDGGRLVLGPADNGVRMEEIASILTLSAARRPVLVLDCDHASAALAETAVRTRIPVLAAGRSSFQYSLDNFTQSLAAAVTYGVFGGRELLTLQTLRDAIEADHVEEYRSADADWLDEPVPPILSPSRMVRVALGVNHAARRVRIRGSTLLPHIAALDQDRR